MRKHINPEIRQRGIASASWMGRIPIQEAEFPAGFGAFRTAPRSMPGCSLAARQKKH